MFDWISLATTKLGTIALAAAMAACFSSATMAQDSPTSPAKLPRPGYEYNGIQIGSLNIVADVDARIDYDSNIFLTSTNPEKDFRLHIDPKLILTKDIGSGAITAEGRMGLRRHLNNVRENSTTYNASVNYTVSGIKGQNFGATIGVSRNIERRADPETRAGPTDRPSKINAFLAEAIYSRSSGRFRITAAVGTEKYNHLAVADDDRDMQVYRGSLTVGYKLRSSLDLFTQVYINRRDFRLDQDFSGVDRDQNTYGAIFGVRRDIGNRIFGRIGVGAFRTEPDKVTNLPPYTGLRLDSEINWMPRDRTAFSLRISKGDVATVRLGSSARIDTIARLTINQEIRHNLLAMVSISYVDLFYRGVSRDNFKSAGGIARLEYLLDRRTSLFTAVEYERRTASDPLDEYKEKVFTLGISRRF